VAAANGAINFVKLLLDHKADVNAKDRWGSTPLDDALAGNHTEVMEYLKSKGGQHGAGMVRTYYGNVSTMDPKSATTMMLLAASQGDVSTIRQLLDKGEVTVDQTDYDRRSAAHLAASEGKLEVLKLLAERGANLNISDRWGNRCLNDAVRSGHVECAGFLRGKGAEESILDEEKKPVSLKNASPEVMAELHRRGVREFWALDHDDFEVEAQPFAKGVRRHRLATTLRTHPHARARRRAGRFFARAGATWSAWPRLAGA
jgi:ankyrin repeat protein